jgi:uncharacterized membrane protein
MEPKDDSGKTDQPSTEEILGEVKRRQAKRRRVKGERKRRFIILADRFIFWLSQNWLGVFNTLAFLYVGLPFLAPTLMHFGARGLGSIIYTMYRPLCHQLPQRSWFLFGPQIAYRLPELIAQSRGAVTGPWANQFVGNEALGYKVAFCQRDTAIYGAIFLSGLIYGLLRDLLGWDIRPLPWWAYIGLGIMPMGIDGGYQLLSYAIPTFFPNFPITLKPHETTPLMRVITGLLFGWATVWLSYPYVQESMDEIEQSLQQRFERIEHPGAHNQPPQP